MPSSYILKSFPSRRDLTELTERYPGLDIDVLEPYLHLLRLSAGILEATDRDLARHRTSQAKLSLLIQLSLSPETAMMPSDLADKIGVARPTITGVLDGLERDGLVRRDKLVNDRRAVNVRLTPKGKKCVDDILPERFQRIAGLMGGLSPEELRSLARLLEKVSQNLPGFGKVH